MLRAPLEWVEVSPGTTVVASIDRAWLHKNDGFSGGDAFGLPMSGASGTYPDAFRKLLDGVIGAAQEQARQSHSEPAPPLTPARWVYRLSGYYHTTHATPSLMNEAFERFREMGRPALAQWAKNKAREEAGHDVLALRDIQAMGFDADRVLAVLKPDIALRLVGLFTSFVRAADPIGCVGYAYALEKLAALRDSGYIAYVKSILPPGTDATRCLRVHSGAGSDVNHVEDTVRMGAALSAPERTQIAIACYETAALCYTAPQGGHISDRELQEQLAAI